MKPENLRLINAFLGDFQSEMIDEKWVDVPVYTVRPTKISSYGRLARYKTKDKWKLGKNGFDKDEYISWTIGAKTQKAHRLVCMCFIPNPENKPCVNHKNGVKTDNRVDNLEWCTFKENDTHAREYGLNKTFGSGNGASKLNEEKVLEIIENKYNLTNNELSVKYNISYSVITAIRRRKTWKHL